MAILKYKDHPSISPITGYQHYNTDSARIRSVLKEIRSLTLYAPGNFQKFKIMVFEILTFDLSYSLYEFKDIIMKK